MSEPPEEVITAVQSIHGCSREEALAIIERDIAAVRAAAWPPCPLCDEPVTAKHIVDRAQRVGGLGGNRYAHRECLLRNSMGGIGHLEDHAYWCHEMHDPDGGRTRRQSALEVDDWVHEHGVEAAVRDIG